MLLKTVFLPAMVVLASIRWATRQNSGDAGAGSGAACAVTVSAASAATQAVERVLCDLVMMIP